MMNYRSLLKANLSVSEISFGCMSIDLNRDDNKRIIQTAIDGGINYFDTADLYDKGENERFIGKALKAKRKELIIATKVGNQWREDGSGWDWNPSKDYILKAAEDSLKRLQTDYIDIYQLHGGTIEDNGEEVIEAFELLQTQGKIRHYGISSIRPNVIREFTANSNIVSNMIQYSLIDRRPEESVLASLHKQGVGVMVRGGLARGVLADKGSIKYLDYNQQSVDLLLDKMKVFSNENTALNHIALQWILNNSAVTSVVQGMRTLEQVHDALALNRSTLLSQAELDEIGSVLNPNIYSDHR